MMDILPHAITAGALFLAGICICLFLSFRRSLRLLAQEFQGAQIRLLYLTRVFHPLMDFSALAERLRTMAKNLQRLY